MDLRPDLGLPDRRMSDDDRVEGKPGDEFVDRPFRIQTDFDGVRADERAAENAARQARHVIALERLEHGH